MFLGKYSVIFLLPSLSLLLMGDEMTLRIQKSENLQDWELLDQWTESLNDSANNVFFRVQPNMTSDMSVLERLEPGTRVRITQDYGPIYFNNTIIGNVIYEGDAIIESEKDFFLIDTSGEYRRAKATYVSDANQSFVDMLQWTDYDKPENTSTTTIGLRQFKYDFLDANSGLLYEYINGEWQRPYNGTFVVIAPSELAPDNLLGMQEAIFLFNEISSYADQFALSFDTDDPHALRVDYGTYVADYTYYYEKLTDSVGRLKKVGVLPSGAVSYTHLRAHETDS